MSGNHEKHQSRTKRHGHAFFNCATLLISVGALGVSSLTYSSSDHLTNLQIDQIKSVINNTPSGTITSLANNTVLPHLQKPFAVWARIRHVPINGDIWLIVHQSFDAIKNNDPDRYYPTPAVYKGHSSYEFMNVFVGTFRDDQAKTYGVGLYFCDSVTNASLEAVVQHPHLRNIGMSFLSPGCQSMDSISVTRKGPN
jgi:hypothetical protein